MPNDDEIMSYITDSFFRDIFFTQLAIIKEEELFSSINIIKPLKLFLKQAFMLHLELEVARLKNPRMDNHYTLQQVKELDYLTENLAIPNITQRNAANQINVTETVSLRRRSRRSHR